MSPLHAVPRVLSIAGTDPSGGAGSPADVKSITVAGGFAYAVTTAIVAQNTQGVRRVWMLEPEMVQAQLDALSADCAIDAVKIGMLGSTEIIGHVEQWVRTQTCPIVVDPVMVATSGDRLIDEDAISALCDLIRAATVITPNIPELEILAGLEPGHVCDYEQACRCAQQVAADYEVVVAVKGGHLQTETMSNALISAAGVIAETTTARIDTRCTHGTGCSFSAALATRRGAGESWQDCLNWTVHWLNDALAAADTLQVGQGHGPVHHAAQLLQRAGGLDSASWRQDASRV